MAELLIKIGDQGPDPHYQNRDTLLAINDRRIAQVHAEHICNPMKSGFNRDGLRKRNSLGFIYLMATCEFQNERVSRETIKRTNLWTMDIDIVGPTPNAKGEATDVPLFLSRRLKNPDHLIFGQPGREVWFGGRRNFSMSQLISIWNAIEADTPHRRVNFREFPWSDNDKRFHLALSVDDFDDAEGVKHESSVVEVETIPVANGRFMYERETILQKRKHFVRYEDLPVAVAVEDLKNPNKVIDVRRDRMFALGRQFNAKRDLTRGEREVIKGRRPRRTRNG